MIITTTLALVIFGTAIIAARLPIVVVSLLIISLPFERIGSFPLNPETGYPLLHVAQIFGMGLLVGLAWRLLRKRESLRDIPKAGYFLLAFFASASVSALVVNIRQVWEIWAWLIFIISLFIGMGLLIPKMDRLLVRKMITIAAVIVCLFGIYQVIGDIVGLPNSVTGIRDVYSKAVIGFPRLQSTALEPLYFANYLFLPLFILLGLALSNQAKRWELAALVVVLITFVLTFSRGAYISGALGLVVLALCFGKQSLGWLRRWWWLAVVGAVGLIVAAFILITYSVDRTGAKNYGVATTTRDFFVTNVLKSGSFTERVRDQKLALKIFREHPVFGVGIGGFGSAYYGCKIGKCVYRPNNQALEVLAEGGIVGFATFHLFLLMLLIYGWRAMKQASGEHRAMLAGLIAATVAMVVQSQTFSGFLCCLTYTWGTLGLLAGLSTSPKDKKVKADA